MVVMATLVLELQLMVAVMLMVRQLVTVAAIIADRVESTIYQQSNPL